jgi:DNA-binding NtrC family response regulator/tetratricopeptide (TPR) repeat protein
VGDLFLTSESYALALAQFTSIQEHPAWGLLNPARQSGIELKIGRARAGIGDYEGALSAGRRAAAALAGAPDARAVALGHAHAFLAHIHRKRGEHRLALDEGLVALDHFRNTEEHAEVAFLQLNVGSVYLREGKLSEAEHYFQDGLATYRRIGDTAGAAKALNGLGVIYNNLGRWQSALSCLRRAADIDESLGNYSQTSLRCLNLGIVYYHLGDWGSARSMLDRSLQMSRSIADAVGVARASIGLARIERWNHSFYKAEQLVRDAIANTRDSGARREAAAAIEEAGALAFARGDMDGAMHRFSEALDAARLISPLTDHDADVSRRIAEVALRRGDLSLAFDRARFAYGAAVRVQDRRLAGSALRVLGSVFRKRGETARAASAFTRAIKQLERIGSPLELARVLREAGSANDGLWCTSTDARGYLIRSQALFRGLGLAHEAGAVLVERARLEMTVRSYPEAMTLLREAERATAVTADDVALRDIDNLRRQIEAELAQHAASLDSEFHDLRRIAHSKKTDVDALLARLVEAARADRGFVSVGEGARAVVRATERMNAAVARGVCRSIIERHRERLVAGEAVISYGDFANGESDVLSYIVVPIFDEGRSLGLLYVDRIESADRSPFGRLELHLVSSAEPFVRAAVNADAANALIDTNLPGESPFTGVVTRSRRMLEILEMLRKVAGASSTILLQGETGTGKGLLAYEISRWNHGPFITINCADLSETVLESELFGHARNAFTGAGNEKRGLFELANGGTVFIDEIDKTSRNFQERLLRVVDRREIKPVGSTSVKKVDCRIIVAANRDLRTQVEKDEFLKDLYYRLRVISIALPPLRERREDIPMLVEYFLDRFQTKMGKAGIRFSEEAMECVENHDWPGNIRDLENEVERAVALASSNAVIQAKDLSEETVGNPVNEILSAGGKRKRLSEVVEEIEVRMVREALREHKGNKCRAAAALGLTRRGLKNKITRYGLE